jgi:hypothetical protein
MDRSRRGVSVADPCWMDSPLARIGGLIRDCGCGMGMGPQHGVGSTVSPQHGDPNLVSREAGQETFHLVESMASFSLKLGSGLETAAVNWVGYSSA